MKNEYQNSDRIERWLAKKEEGRVPLVLMESIMDEIGNRPVGLMNSIRLKLASLQSIVPRSAHVFAGVVILLCGVWLGTLLDNPQNLDKHEQTLLVDSLRTTGPSANHYWGRGLLAAGEVEPSIEFLQKAVLLAPDVPEYLHWLGIAYWSSGNLRGERENYLESVNLQPDYVPSLINLGHSYLETGEYKKALDYYNKVLHFHSDNPNALYNRALTLRLLGEDEAALEAFHLYLHNNRSGRWARRAVDHLYRLGDFSYRSFVLDNKTVVVHLPTLLDNSVAKNREVVRLAKVLRRMSGVELHLVMYVQGDDGQAKSNVRKLKKELSKRLDHIHLPIRTSWFGVAERLDLPGGHAKFVNRSLLLFTQFTENVSKRSST